MTSTDQSVIAGDVQVGGVIRLAAECELSNGTELYHDRWLVYQRIHRLAPPFTLELRATTIILMGEQGHTVPMKDSPPLSRSLSGPYLDDFWSNQVVGRSLPLTSLWR